MDGEVVRLDGQPVERINADLTGDSLNVAKARRLTTNEGCSFVGIQKSGPLNIPGAIARRFLKMPINPNGMSNAMVLRPYWNGLDLVRRDQDIWFIDFADHADVGVAALFEAPFNYLKEHALPERATNKIAWLRDNWWLPWRPRPELRTAVSKLSRFIVTPEVSKHRLFAWMPTSVLPDKNLTVIAREDYTTFGVLQSRFHELWALRMGTWLGKGNDPRYTPTTTFETFPFPEGMSPDMPAHVYADNPLANTIALAASRLDDLRENWLNPADLVRRDPEIAPGYPDRLLPVSEEAAQKLKKRTLTNLYNERPTWLQHAHKALDEAVAAAYGWPADLPDDEVLARLFALNQERTAQASASKAG